MKPSIEDEITDDTYTEAKAFLDKVLQDPSYSPEKALYLAIKITDYEQKKWPNPNPTDEEMLESLLARGLSHEEALIQRDNWKQRIELVQRLAADELARQAQELGLGY